MIRIFIAIEIPENVKKQIIKIQKSLPKFDGKLTEPENLHLTLKFLGEIDEKTLTQVKKKLSQIKFRKFDAKIDFIDVFSPDYIKIIWLHIEGCTNLHKLIDDSLEEIFPKEHRFMSHLTVARVKKIKNKEEFLDKIMTIKLPKMEFPVEKFYLKESVLTRQKPVYKDIEIYNLN